MSRRSILALMVLLLGAVAAPQLRTSFLPTANTPGLSIELSLEQAEDLATLTDRYVVPIESAIRNIGGVEEIVGHVHSRGARLQVRLDRRAGPGNKAARLQAEATRLLRTLLPGNSRLEIEAAGVSYQQDMVLWIGPARTFDTSSDTTPSRTPSASALDRLRSELETVPSVRRVEVAGVTGKTLEIRARQTATSPKVLQEVVRNALAGSYLGDWRPPVAASLGQQSPMYIDSVFSGQGIIDTADGFSGDGSATHDLEKRRLLARDAIARLPVLLPHGDSKPAYPMRLDAVADLSWHEQPGRLSMRKDGDEGAALLVYREPDSTVNELSRGVRRFFGRSDQVHSISVLWDQAEAMTRLLRHVGLALVLAAIGTLALGLGLGQGWHRSLWWGLSLPLATSATATSLLWLSRLQGSGLESVMLDVTTLPVILLGLGAGPMAFALRQLGLASTVSMVPLMAAVPLITTRLTGQGLAALLATPTQLFLITVAIASLTGFLPPASPAQGTARGPVQRRSMLITIAILRHGWAIALSLLFFSYFATSLASKSLEPRSRSLEGALADISLSLRFSEATTLEQATEQIEIIERHLMTQEEVASVQSLFGRDSGSVLARTHPEFRTRRELARLARQVEYQLAELPVGVRVGILRSSASDSEAVDMTGRLGSRAKTDREATSYRFLLTSTRLADLEQTLATVRRRLHAADPGSHKIQSDWEIPRAAMLLEPRLGTSGEEIELARQALIQLLGPAATYPLPGNLDDYAVVSVHGRSTARGSPGELRDSYVLTRALPSPVTTNSSGVAIETHFNRRSVVTPPTVRREDGRFVLPVEVHNRSSPPKRVESRRRIALALGNLRPPPSVQVVRPRFDRWAWLDESFWALRAFVALPVLLLLLASIRLNSVALGASAVLAVGVGVAVNALQLRVAGENISELGLLTLSAALCLATPMSVTVAAAAAQHLSRGSMSWARFSGRALPALAIASLAVSLPPLLAQLAVNIDVEPWAMPLRLGGLGLLVTCLTGVVATPLLVAGRFSLQRFNRQTRLGRTRPENWQRLGSLASSASESPESVPQLETRNLTKQYRDTAAPSLSSVDFLLEPGITGLLGPNGAGKTTLLRLLCGLIEPSRGHVRFQGIQVSPLNIASFRQHVGFLPQGFQVYEATTARLFLDFWALEKGLLERSARAREIDRVLELVDMTTDADREVRNFSGGMRRRIGIARALLGDPPILIVDEPTTGLDLESRNRLRQSLLRVASSRIVLFSTHIASDIAGAAKRILVLEQGRLMFNGTSHELIEAAAGSVFETEIADPELQNWSRGRRISTRVRTPTGVRMRFVVARQEEVPSGANEVRPNIEEAYLSLMARDGRNDSQTMDYASLLDLSPDRQLRKENR